MNSASTLSAIKRENFGNDHKDCTRSKPATSGIMALLNRVALNSAPLWSLRDLVAVNPFLGYAGYPVETAHAVLRRRLNTQLLPSIEILRGLYKEGHFNDSHIDKAVRHYSSRDNGAYPTVDELKNLLSANYSPEQEYPYILSFAAWLDLNSPIGGKWVNGITVDIGRLCSARYDEGIAKWSAFKRGSLFGAWKRYASSSRAMHARGLQNFHSFVSSLPVDKYTTAELLLNQLGISSELLEDYLNSLLGEIPGWAGYLRRMIWEISQTEPGEVIDLLVIRLAYEVALLQADEYRSESTSYRSHLDATPPLVNTLRRSHPPEALLLYSLETSYREQLFWENLRGSNLGEQKQSTVSPEAQVVFCIDVRSEVLRRHLTAQSRAIDCYGFAGFFGLPIKIPNAKGGSQPQCPVLLQPALIAAPTTERPDSFGEKIRKQTKTLLKQISLSAPTCFTYVETLGFFSAFKLFRELVPSAKRDAHKLSHTEYVLDADLETKSNLAVGILKTLSLKRPYARLVLFCGHKSSTSNNPQEAALNCGACAGHSGAPNASAAANLLNDLEVRKRLATLGWDIPDETVFLAGVHDTTIDEVSIIGTVPESHKYDLLSLHNHLSVACLETRKERATALGLPPTTGPEITALRLKRRATDISEVRPEWALAGNASFIIAPAQTVASSNFNGRSFLHNYDESADTDGSILETILTAPVVVASWINLQYFASSIDPTNFGSGLKTIHNITSGIGVTCGNDGDLAVGLSAQSVHTGTQLRHIPIRLHVVVQASQARIDSILAKHSGLNDLVTNEWILLFSTSAGFDSFYRRMPDRSWSAVSSPN